MASLLDTLASDQERADNADIAQSQHDLNWTSTFRSTPPAEVLRARVNYADTVDRALSNKIALQARSDVKALQLQQKAAEHDEWVRQAPLREELLRAHVDATGATERRKAEESTMTAQQTANLNRGLLNLYKSGVTYGTPEFQQGALALIADNPRAHADHITEIGKMTGVGTDLTPEQYVAKAVVFRDKMKAAGFPNVQIHSYGGKPVPVQGSAAAEVVKPTPEQKVDKTLASMVGGSLSFGLLDDKGKIVPNKEGDTNAGRATHVSSFYPDPTTGKMIRTPPMTISEFQKLQERIKTPPAAVVAQTPDGTVAAVDPNAPAPNQAALDWLKANPDDPRAAAVKAKLGM